MATRKTRLTGLAGAVTAMGMLAVGVVGNYEGLRLYAYKDVVGVWTACYGETKGIKPGMKFTKEQCDVMFIESLTEHEQGMRKCMLNPDAVPEKSYVAFLSLTYNIGTGGYCKSTVAKRVNAGNITGACDAILSWNKGGKPLRAIKGLTIRRQAERKLCLEGAHQ